MSDLLKIRFEKNGVVCLVEEFVVPAIAESDPVGVRGYRVSVPGVALPSDDGSGCEYHHTLGEASQAALNVIEYLLS